jgi:APA family basic amino acid/polyamine antiporter
MDPDAKSGTRSATGSDDGHGPKELPRILGLFDATMIVVGSIIGSGIFLKVSAVDSRLQAYGFAAILGIWLFVGIITLCGALAMAELGAMFPQAGGPYLYLRESFGRIVGFLWGWTEFWIVRTGSVGALACATVIYFNELLPTPPAVQTGLACAIVVGLSLVNLFSTRAGATLQSIATVAKVVFLAALIVLPLLFRATDPELLKPWWQPPSGPGAWPAFFKALGLAMVAVLWPYDGWINLGPVAEDIREPHRNVPRGLAIGLGLVIIVYLGANFSYHLVLPTSHLAQSETVAADVFGRVFGKTGAMIAALGIMISTFGATNSNMITGPRIYLAIARDGLVPQWLQRIHPRYLTPANTIIIQAVWTVILILVFSVWHPDASGQAAAEVTHSEQMYSTFSYLTDAVICAGLIFYSLAVAAVYVLRAKRPEIIRPYRTWGYPVTPALLLIAYAGAFASMIISQWFETLCVLGLIAAGAVYYVLASRTLRRVE